MLPRVKITFENGVLGSVVPSADGVAGLACSAVAVAGKLQLATPYLLRRLADLADLGVNAETTGVNAFLYKTVREFYDEAGSGAELWLMCFPQSEIQSDIVNPAKNNARALIAAANGRLRALAVAYRPPDGTPGVLEDGVSANLWPAMYNAQALAEQATAERFAPLIILLEARGWNGVATALRSLTEYSYNRVGVLLGDTVSALNGAGAAVGLLLGRIARIPVQRHIGRVRDGAVKSTVIFLSERKPENTDVETINDRGYITFRTFTGKAGYYFSDDSLATGETDDYRSLARRRTIDKAYRIAYETLVEFLLDEIPLADDGTPSPAIMRAWEMEVETAIAARMTAEGNLGVDPSDPSDKGVKCRIDTSQNVVATGRIEIALKVKPYGYAKYIDVKLGFLVEN